MAISYNEAVRLLSLLLSFTCLGNIAQGANILLISQTKSSLLNLSVQTAPSLIPANSMTNTASGKKEGFVIVLVHFFFVDAPVATSKSTIVTTESSDLIAAEKLIKSEYLIERRVVQSSSQHDLTGESGLRQRVKEINRILSLYSLDALANKLAKLPHGETRIVTAKDTMSAINAVLLEALPTKQALNTNSISLAIKSTRALLHECVKGYGGEQALE